MYELIFRNTSSSIRLRSAKKVQMWVQLSTYYLYICFALTAACMTLMFFMLHYHLFSVPGSINTSNGRNSLSIIEHTHNWRIIDANQFYILHTFSFVSALNPFCERPHTSLAFQSDYFLVLSVDVEANSHELSSSPPLSLHCDCQLLYFQSLHHYSGIGRWKVVGGATIVVQCLNWKLWPHDLELPAMIWSSG